MRFFFFLYPKRIFDGMISEFERVTLLQHYVTKLSVKQKRWLYFFGIVILLIASALSIYLVSFIKVHIYPASCLTSD